MELNRSFTLPVHLDHNEESEACKRDIVTVSPRECISDVEASMDSDFFSSLRNSISSNRSSIVNNENSSFTPVRKRERSVSLSPIGSLRKSLRFDSSAHSSPFVSRSNSSITTNMM